MYTQKTAKCFIIFCLFIFTQPIMSSWRSKLRLAPKKHSTKAFNKLHDAIDRGNTKKVKHILSKYNIKINKFHDDDMTALHRAVERGNYDIIKDLVHAGADVNIPEKQCKKVFFFIVLINSNIRTHTIQNRSGATPLFTAICNNNLAAAHLLLEHGAHASMNGQNAHPLLLAAVIQKTSHAMQLLIDYGLPINTSIKLRNGIKHTILSIAAMQGHIKMVKLLLKKGADVNGNIDTCPPLHKAIQYNYTLITKLLIRRRADVNKIDNTDNKGNSPLQLAKSLPIAQFLVDHGADTHQRDKTMQTPLHKAAFGGFGDIVRFLIEQGANTEARDKSNATAANTAYIMGHDAIGHYITDAQNTYNTLEDNLQTQPTQSLLDSNEDFELYIYMHHNNMLTNTIRTYIVPQKWVLYAIRCHHRDALKLLCQQQHILSEINQPKATGGNTALHITAKYHDAEMLTHLIRHGAHPIQINNYKQTPYNTAQKYENQKAGKILAKCYTLTNIFNHARNQYANTENPPAGMIPPEIVEYIIRYL